MIDRKKSLPRFLGDLGIELPGPLIYWGLRGSRAVGTDDPGSDYDFAGVYVETLDSVLGGTKPPATISIIRSEVGADITIWPLRRFFELAAKCNPTVLELLWSPQQGGLHAATFRAMRGNITYNKQAVRVLCHCARGYLQAHVAGKRNKNGKAGGVALRFAWFAQEAAQGVPLSLPRSPEEQGILRAVTAVGQQAVLTETVREGTDAAMAAANLPDKPRPLGMTNRLLHRGVWAL